MPRTTHELPRTNHQLDRLGDLGPFNVSPKPDRDGPGQGDHPRLADLMDNRPARDGSGPVGDFDFDNRGDAQFTQRGGLPDQFVAHDWFFT